MVSQDSIGAARPTAALKDPSMGFVSAKVISIADEHSCGPGGAVGSGAAVGEGGTPSTGFGGAGTCVGRGVGLGAFVG